ncbi:hypothetical protein [Nannocystis pusilla]|uniref:hypothetical protein n=1 Tax=Nannocystis pusilla TaxID=889268 RepID=UPI003B8020F1
MGQEVEVRGGERAVQLRETEARGAGERGGAIAGLGEGEPRRGFGGGGTSGRSGTGELRARAGRDGGRVGAG